jgi:hypothetical protein
MRRGLLGSVEEIDDAGFEVVRGADVHQAALQAQLF